MSLAADQPAQDGQTAIILGVIGLLTAVLVAVAGGVFSLLSARANRTSPSSPPPLSHQQDLAFRDYVVGELAVSRRRDDDHDDAREIFDRRLDRIERHLDLDSEWPDDGR